MDFEAATLIPTLQFGQFGRSLGSSFSPPSLFSGGTNGGYYDFTDASTLYSDTGFTTPSSTDGQIRGVVDLSGNGNNLTTATTTILMRAGTYADFPGAVVGFARNFTGGLGSSSGWTALAAIRPSSIGATGQWMDADYSNGATTRIAQAIWTDSTQGSLAFYGGGTGSTNKSTTAAGISAGSDYVLTHIFSTTALTLRKNGSQTTQLTFGAVVPNSGVAFFGLGSGWTGTAVQDQRRCTGRMYAALFINRQLTATELSDVEASFMKKAGL